MATEIDFCKITQDLSAKNEKRVSGLIDTLGSVTKFDEENMADMTYEVAGALETACQRYKEVMPRMRTMCATVINSHDEYKSKFDSSFYQNITFSNEFNEKMRFVIKILSYNWRMKRLVPYHRSVW